MKLNNRQEFRQLVKDLKRDNQKTTISVGYGTCGIASGADKIYERLFNLVNNDQVELKIVGCIGDCYLEPIVEIRKDRKVRRYNKVQLSDVELILNNLDIFDQDPTTDKQTRIALENCGVVNPSDINDYLKYDGYQAFTKALFDMDQNKIIEEIKNSGLRGRGGAGFPTWKKWEALKNKKDLKKYIICNADEGDPGAFMDRAILEGNPHKIVEALLIAGIATKGNQGIIYIRAEYPLAIKRLQLAIQEARMYGLIGQNILGTNFSFNIGLSFGAGAFVCGEETALINSISGLRGEPHNRPPYPSDKGLFDRPTIINNVETLSNVVSIIQKGSNEFNKIGTETSKGTKIFALAGEINNVGLIEVPMGTTLREVIYNFGGGIKDNKNFKAIQIGGPSGGVIPENLIDTKIDYESLSKIGSMMGSGGMIIMADDSCMVDIAKFYLKFSVDESCGKCVPCRIGNFRLLEILERITKGEGTAADLDKLENLGQSIKDTALCGLGQTSPNPALSTLKFFREEFIEHLNGKCSANKCFNSVKYTIEEDKCIGCGICAKKCPNQCIEGELKTPYKIDQEKCSKCGICFEACPKKAIAKGE